MQNLINSLLSLQCHHSHHSGLDNRIHLELLSSCKWFCHRVFQSTCEDFLWQKYCCQQLKNSKSILLNATINTVTTATIVIIGISISIMIIKTKHHHHLASDVEYKSRQQLKTWTENGSCWQIIVCPSQQQEEAGKSARFEIHKIWLIKNQQNKKIVVISINLKSSTIRKILKNQFGT